MPKAYWISAYRAIHDPEALAASALLTNLRELDLRQNPRLTGRGKQALRGRFDKNLQAFLSLAEAAKHYPCIKRAWIEFLGEPPGSGWGTFLCL